MSALLFGHDEAVAGWVAEKAKGKPFSQPFTAIGIVDGTGRLQGGFVFTGHTGDAIELSLAGRGVANRGGMAAVIQYVFNQLKCSRMSMHTRRSNKRVKRMLATKLGVHYEGVARRMYGREDGITYSLTVDDLPAFRKKWRL